jgi:hypothetical protein
MRSAACLSLLLVLHAVAGEEPVPLGKLVDIGGYRLHLYCTGRRRQTVLLSPGGGDFSFDWYWCSKESALSRVSAPMTVRTVPGATPARSLAPCGRRHMI